MGLQQSEVLCQRHGENLEVLKFEQTNTEHRGEETCSGSECRLESQLAQIPLALYVLSAREQGCLRALPYCMHFGLVAADFSCAFYQLHTSLWYPSGRFFLSLLLSTAAHSLGAEGQEWQVLLCSFLSWVRQEMKRFMPPFLAPFSILWLYAGCLSIRTNSQCSELAAGPMPYW